MRLGIGLKGERGTSHCQRVVQCNTAQMVNFLGNGRVEDGGVWYTKRAAIG